ncbi:MAG: hypothetical protein ACKOXB_06200 [Flavobacteriales bacterium]
MDSTLKNKARVIFILGIMPRSGTHFLGNLLCHHPDCIASAIPEDGLVVRSNSFTKFVKQNIHQWHIHNDLPDIPAKDLLTESIGEGLVSFCSVRGKFYPKGKLKI